ncbi:leucine-rich repeat and transmembrane domain-containing protein 1 [Leucoraja erinacea]|uniref:leucine-rich repeat and transmembrane domain-containing protein 1 n=1 Tax=Leucoraja erinaceus TaxID=7782 RepID=UPI00245553B8|nr:leucine-rich repeat and transmembrane domain-containing protein 1 [Leucoraja erinacea]
MLQMYSNWSGSVLSQGKENDKLETMRGDIALGMIAFLFVQSVTGCPEKCQCMETEKVVRCTGTGLSQVPRGIALNTETLYLQNNQIHTISNADFTGMSQLQTLDLSNNIISNLSSDTFDGLHNLLILKLANNSITNVDNKMLHSTGNLHQLDLSFNHLTSLPEGLFNNLQNLTSLAMHQNQLQHISRSLVDSLPSLQAIMFRKNQWKCDCHLTGLKLWLESFLYTGGKIDEILCTEPEDLRSKDLMRIPHELFQVCSSVKDKSSHVDSDQRSPTIQTLQHKLEPEHSPDCTPKAKQRSGSLRHAIATIVVTGVICGIVCLMMLVAAVYGCSYAFIMAKYQRELKKLDHLGPDVEQENAEEKEPLDSSLV